MHLVRHDLVFLDPAAWEPMVAAHEGLAEAVIAEWVPRGRPLIVRRYGPGEADGVPLGLPLPPALGKRRISLLARPGAVVRTAPPPLLAAAMARAPAEWRPTLRRIDDLAQAHGFAARLFGGLAWQYLTGLDYLTSNSDLDLLLPLPEGDVAGFTRDLAAIEADAPMRLDGELVRADGAAVNWRELHEGARQVMVKTLRAVMLVERDGFTAEEPV